MIEIILEAFNLKLREVLISFVEDYEDL